MEKETIIDEVFRETGVRIDSIFDMKIEELKGNKNAPNNCPVCNRELTVVYERFVMNNPFELLVLKCQVCHVTYSYWWEEPDEGPTFDDNEGYVLSKRGKPIISEGAAAEYMKAISTRESRNIELTRVFQEKLPTLCKAGLSLETLNLARNHVASYINQHNVSSKSITKLLAAAIYAKANGESTLGLWKHHGEGITEEEVEKIFETTRKTIRKWKKVFEVPLWYISNLKLQNKK